MPTVRGRAHAIEIYRTLGVSNVIVLSRPEMVVVPTKAGPVRIAAMPYLIKGLLVAREEFQGKSLEETRQIFEAKYVQTLRQFKTEIQSANDDTPTILLGHFWAQGATLSTWQAGYFSLQEPQVPLEELIDPAFDYVALGHIHRQQDMNPKGQPHVVYSGSPDRIDFGEKDEEKGFMHVRLWKGGADCTFFPVQNSRRLLELDIDADCDAPTEKIVATIKRQSLRNAIVKLTYSIGAERLPMVHEREIREALAPAFFVVSIQRRVTRATATRGSDFSEAKTPRENLALYLERDSEWATSKDRLLEFAEPLFRELAEEEGEI
jgi:exonuclease SbcD